MFRFLLYLTAVFYRAIYKLHHAICLRPGAPLEYSKLVVIGSFRTGGAGKTPFCIWLSNRLAAQGKRIAILCHKYAFDEIAMLRDKFPDDSSVKIFKTKNRYRTAHELDKTRKFDIILCDDGFEDSRLVKATIIVLSWEKEPTQIYDLWPLGNMRSLAQDHKHSDRTITLQCSGESPELQFVIDKVSSYANKEFPKNEKPILLCGIGKPERFKQDISKFGIEATKLFSFKDHCRNFAQKMEFILKTSPDTSFIITEKDAARLPKELLQLNERVYIATQKAIVAPSALQKMERLGL